MLQVWLKAQLKSFYSIESRKAWVCDLSLAVIAGSNSTSVHGYLSLVSVVCCQVEVLAMDRSVVQRSVCVIVRVCVYVIECEQV
jgi:hypothetical protein